MDKPTLVVVTGPPGAGTTTLAHELARLIPCPAVCRDEIKEGLVHGDPTYVGEPGDDVAYRALDVFFGVVGFLLDAGVTLVAEASFQHARWEMGLPPLAEKSTVRIVRCRADAAVARTRVAARADEFAARMRIHGDPNQLMAQFDEVALPLSTLDVDTTDGYKPALERIVAFVRADWSRLSGE